MKTVLITGSSTGIGKATAKTFQSKGWNVVATMRSPDKETELNGLENVLVTRLDVEDRGSIDAAVAAGIERFGRIDALVNNAGYGAFGVLEATPTESIRRQFDVNVLGLLATTQAVLPHFRAAKSGVVVNISSVGGRMAFPLGTLYHGTKWAVEGMSEAMSFELGAIGVRVKIVEPGAIQSDFGTRSFDFSNDESMAEYQPVVGALMERMPEMMGNALPAADCAATIYEAATDESDRLRYVIGPDAEQYLAGREAAPSDEAFLAGIRTAFGM